MTTKTEERLTPTVGHCRDVLTMGRRHLAAALKDGEVNGSAWDELATLRRDLAKYPREATVDRETWQRCRAVGNATGRQAIKAWWNARRWGGTRPD